MQSRGQGGCWLGVHLYYRPVSRRATIVFLIPVAYGRLAVDAKSAAVRGHKVNILWLEMNVPKMQQAYIIYYLRFTEKERRVKPQRSARIVSASVSDSCP